MRTILITGGGGYVGSLLIPKLLQRNYKVKVYDWFIFDSNIFKNIKNENLKIIKGDIRDYSKLESELQGVDEVIHLAALSNDASCEIDENLTKDINYFASKELIKLSKKNGVKRFYFASSASVYGIKDEENVTENFSLEPISSYAKYKAYIEEELLSQLSNSFSGVIVRPATLYGYAPRQRLDLTVNILTYHAVLKNKITVLGGQQKRPNLSVRDMVETYLLLIETETNKIHGEIFNVNEVNLKVIDIATLVKESLDRNVEIEVVGTNDFRSYHMSADKIKDKLGFRPKYQIKDEIRLLGNALLNGLINDPDNDRYRNVNFMKTRMESFFSIIKGK
ncbi:NAD-dependent epimerase/dehydratase family protein [Tepidibacillus infernus]|uniref:NAD-dependent epimerase/dehydratase family protein n=1 Tax=Tepidibacillus infernus TaxID=1806172 RepID=UPI003B6AA226